MSGIPATPTKAAEDAPTMLAAPVPPSPSSGETQLHLNDMLRSRVEPTPATPRPSPPTPSAVLPPSSSPSKFDAEEDQLESSLENSLAADLTQSLLETQYKAPLVESAVGAGEAVEEEREDLDELDELDDALGLDAGEDVMMEVSVLGEQAVEMEVDGENGEVSMELTGMVGVPTPAEEPVDQLDQLHDEGDASILSGIPADTSLYPMQSTQHVGSLFPSPAPHFEASAPSSSPAIADILLSRNVHGRKAYQSLPPESSTTPFLTGTQPSSSTEPSTSSAQGLQRKELSTIQEGSLGASAGSEVQSGNVDSSELSSTPRAPPVVPQRTAIAFLPRAVVPAPSVPPVTRILSNSPSKGYALYQSSLAMDAPVKVPVSTEAGWEIREAQSQPTELEETQASGEGTSEPAESAPVTESHEVEDAKETGDLDAKSLASTQVESLPGAPVDDTQPGASSESVPTPCHPSPSRQRDRTPLFHPSNASTASQTQTPDGPTRISDIGALPSSMAEPSQLMVDTLIDTNDDIENYNADQSAVNSHYSTRYIPGFAYPGAEEGPQADIPPTSPSPTKYPPPSSSLLSSQGATPEAATRESIPATLEGSPKIVPTRSPSVTSAPLGTPYVVAEREVSILRESVEVEVEVALEIIEETPMDEDVEVETAVPVVEEVIEPVAEEEMEDHAVPKAKKFKGNGKAKSKVVDAGLGPSPKSNNARTYSKLDKGKGRALPPPTDSPDALDLFQKSLVMPSSSSSMDIDEGFQETNYDEVPHGRRSSKSKSQVVAALARKGKRKEPVEVEILVAKRSKGSPVASRTARTKSAAKNRRSGGSSRPVYAESESEEEEEEEDRRASDATSGPSRRRLDSNDPVLSSPSKLTMRLPKSRLPASAPFNRVFGFWRNDSGYYPATIIDLVDDRFRVIFDDGSPAELKSSQVRRCELVQGDYVRYGGEEIETETQAVVLKKDLKVLRVERGTTGEDWVSTLAQDDIIVATLPEVALKDQAAAHRKERLLVEAIWISSKRASQLDDRQLTDEEIASFEDSKSGIVPKRLKLLSVPDSKLVPLVVNRKKNGIFSGVGFIVTQAPWSANGPTKRFKAPSAAKVDAEKEDYIRLLESHGATIVEPTHLFAVGSDDATSATRLSFASPSAFKGIESIFLLSDRPTSTPKYLLAQGLAILCLSKEFVRCSIDEGERLDWKRFVMSTGYLHSIGAYVVGHGQIKALCKPRHDLASILEGFNDDGVFHDVSILAVVSKKGKSAENHMTQISSLRSILAAGGAERVDFVSTLDAGVSGEGYDYVFLDDKSGVPSPMANHEGLCNVEWMKQCLIAGRLLDAERVVLEDV